MCSFTVWHSRWVLPSVLWWEEHLACKNWVVWCCHSYMSGLRYRWLHIVQVMPLPHHHLLLHWNPKWFNFWCQLIQVVLKKRLFNEFLLGLCCQSPSDFHRWYYLFLSFVGLTAKSVDPGILIFLCSLLAARRRRNGLYFCPVLLVGWWVYAVKVAARMVHLGDLVLGQEVTGVRLPC